MYIGMIAANISKFGSDTGCLLPVICVPVYRPVSRNKYTFRCACIAETHTRATSGHEHRETLQKNEPASRRNTTRMAKNRRAFTMKYLEWTRRLRRSVASICGGRRVEQRAGLGL
jgi:hypothetical protein